MSEKILISHYENNYGGAARRLNSIADRRVMEFSHPVRTTMMIRFPTSAIAASSPQ